MPDDVTKLADALLALTGPSHTDSPELRQAAVDQARLALFVVRAARRTYEGVGRTTLVRVLKEVRADLPWISDGRVSAGQIVEVEVNPLGAVFAKLPDGDLGLKPGEFEWIDDQRTVFSGPHDPRALFSGGRE